MSMCESECLTCPIQPSTRASARFCRMSEDVAVDSKVFRGTAANSTSDIDDTADMLALSERPPETVAPPGAHDVHVWAIDLRQPHAGETPDRVLSRDELARADRFVPPGLRERFVAARA